MLAMVSRRGLLTAAKIKAERKTFGLNQGPLTSCEGMIDPSKAMSYIPVRFRDFVAKIAAVQTVPGETYTANTLGIQQSVPFGLRPVDEAQVLLVVEAAAATGIRLFPISTGKNWGYGGALSGDPEAVILDLSLMRDIQFNERDQSFSLQPGVTQQQLFDFLQARDLKYLVPTTGAGPNVSIVGNLLERGYGVTPIEDHFSSLLSLRAILPDGSSYRPAMSELSGTKLWRWDVGPYLQGLFSQSSLGVVTEATIQLYPEPDVVGFMIAQSDNVEACLAFAKALRRSEVVKGVNVMNSHRMAAMSKAKNIGKKWTVLGTFFCHKELLGGVRRMVCRSAKAHGLRAWTIDQPRYARVKRIIQLVAPTLATVVNGCFDALRGVPTRVALNLVGGEANIGNVGLIWFSPVAPCDPKTIVRLTSTIRQVCERHHIAPLMTCTLVSPFAVDITVPILFKPGEQGEDAWRCYDELFRACKEMGSIPYRYPINRMHLLRGTQAHAFHQRLKTSLDPHTTLCAGKYL